MSSQGRATIEGSSSDDDDALPPKFQTNQRVFCPEHDNLYEAVIKKTSFKGSRWTYFVHFLGWNIRWDKWVEEQLLREPTDELRIQAAAQAAAKAALEKEAKKVKEATKQALLEKKRKKREDAGDGARGARGGKRRYDSSDGRSSASVWEDYCELPFTLKTILIDERERIMRINNVAHTNAGVDTDFEPGHWRPPRDVHNVPASVTIKTVLNHYVKVKKKEAAAAAATSTSSEVPVDSNDIDAVAKAKSFVEGLSQLFEEALPVCLLYHPERAQYMAIQSDPALKVLRKTEIYGCELLLRLFVRLPTILSTFEERSRRDMGLQLQDLIILLQKNRQACFKAKYREPKRPEELNDFEKALCSSVTTTTTTSTIPMEDASL